MDLQAKWDDLRVFLAVAQQGSLAGAARQLRVTHPTAFRRLGAFEEALGVRLFDRLPNRYVLTPAGAEMLAAAQRIEDDLTGLIRKFAGRDLDLSGTLRVTTVDSMGESLLVPHFAAFHAAYPGIELEVVISEQSFNLSKREADVAIRVSGDPPGHLVGRVVAEMAHAVYCSEGYLAEHEMSDLTVLEWVCDTGETPMGKWLRRAYPHVRPVVRFNTVMAMMAAVRAGIGIGPLPCCNADPHPDLKRLTAPYRDGIVRLWLLTHEDLRHTARVRAFLDFMAASLARDRDLYEGLRPQPDVGSPEPARIAARRTRGP